MPSNSPAGIWQAHMRKDNHKQSLYLQSIIVVGLSFSLVGKDQAIPPISSVRMKEVLVVNFDGHGTVFATRGLVRQAHASIGILLVGLLPGNARIIGFLASRQVTS
jgi:hypothetical protein